MQDLPNKEQLDKIRKAKENKVLSGKTVQKTKVQGNGNKTV